MIRRMHQVIGESTAEQDLCERLLSDPARVELVRGPHAILHNPAAE